MQGLGVPWGSPSHLEETSSVSHEFRTVLAMPSPWEVTILGVTVEVGALLPHLGLTDACWVQGCSSKSETPKPPHCASSLLPPGSAHSCLPGTDSNPPRNQTCQHQKRLWLRQDELQNGLSPDLKLTLMINPWKEKEGNSKIRETR